MEAGRLAPTASIQQLNKHISETLINSHKWTGASSILGSREP